MGRLLKLCGFFLCYTFPKSIRKNAGSCLSRGLGAPQKNRQNLKINSWFRLLDWTRFLKSFPQQSTCSLRFSSRLPKPARQAHKGLLRCLPSWLFAQSWKAAISAKSCTSGGAEVLLGGNDRFIDRFQPLPNRAEEQHGKWSFPKRIYMLLGKGWKKYTA